MPSEKKLTMYDDIRVPVRLKLCALWSSVIFCYLYGDYFSSTSPDNSRE